MHPEIHVIQNQIACKGIGVLLGHKFRPVYDVDLYPVKEFYAFLQTLTENSVCIENYIDLVECKTVDPIYKISVRETKVLKHHICHRCGTVLKEDIF